MLLLASCGLSLSTAADGNEFSPRGLGGADSTNSFAPASTPSTTRDARLPQSGVLEARLADGYGVGAIRLRVGQEPGNPRVTRLDTTWSAAVPGQRDTLRLGDSIDQPGTWGRQVRFAGLHFGTDLGSHLAAAPPEVPEAANAMYAPRAAPALLQPGLVDRAFAAGFLRRNYGLDGDR
jgi:outer membrane usher protein